MESRLLLCYGKRELYRSASLSLSEKWNLERHFMTRHAKYNDGDYPSGGKTMAKIGILNQIYEEDNKMV